MLLRAAFWIGVVALLAPHEPDLGFGRPTTLQAPAAAKKWIVDTARAPSSACTDSCASLLDEVQSVAVKSLDCVTSRLKDQERRRAS